MNVLLAVADGLGGHSAGDVASRIVIESLAARMANLAIGDTDGITGAVTFIDEELKLKATSDPSLRGMGSTLAMAIVSAEAMTVLNVGDSRVYMSEGDGDMRQISIDDVPVARPDMRSQDRSADSVARRSTHLVTQALGGSSLRANRLLPHVVNLRMSGSWTLLLCSDGLTDFVDDRVFNKKAISAACGASDLVKLALDAGGKDNISVVIARCKIF
jgi:protein phosphatase